MPLVHPDVLLGRALLANARDAIAAELSVPFPVPAVAHPALREQGASFVTLTIDGRLRGCIGSLQPHRALRADVRANAVSAATRDPRFAPLSRDEFRVARVEVSVLEPAQPLEADSADHASAQLRPFEDGVILAWRGRRAPFLPQVWEALPLPADFLRELRRKAGLAPEFWDRDLRLWRYAVAKWKESEVDQVDEEARS